MTYFGGEGLIIISIFIFLWSASQKSRLTRTIHKYIILRRGHCTSTVDPKHSLQSMVSLDWQLSIGIDSNTRRYYRNRQRHCCCELSILSSTCQHSACYSVRTYNPRSCPNFHARSTTPWSYIGYRADYHKRSLKMQILSFRDCNRILPTQP